MIPAGEWGSRHCIMSFALVWRTVLRQIHWLHELILRLAMDLVARLKKLWAFFFWLLIWLGEVSSLIIRMVTYVEWFILDFWHCLIQECSTKVTIANTRLVLRLFLPQNLRWRDRVCLLQIDEASDAYSFFAMVTNSNWIGWAIDTWPRWCIHIWMTPILWIPWKHLWRSFCWKDYRKDLVRWV